LVLLDYDPVTESSLSLSEVAKELKAAESEYKSGIVNDEMKVIVLNSLTQKQEFKAIVRFAELENLNINKGPTAIIIPVKLTGIEEEAVNSMYV
jgi:diphthamide biosynthesis methyltransferase